MAGWRHAIRQEKGGGGDACGVRGRVGRQLRDWVGVRDRGGEFHAGWDGYVVEFHGEGSPRNGSVV